MAPISALKNQLKHFIEDDTRSEIVFPSSLSKSERASLHRFAQGYGLKTFSTGDGDDRYLTIQKTDKFVSLKKERNTFRNHRSVIETSYLNLSDQTITCIERLGAPSKADIRRLLPVATPTVSVTRNNDVFDTHKYPQPAIPPLGINQQMIEFRSTLPVYEKQRAIFEAIENNPVTIICGETGCGKTTQVPQLILTSAHVNQKPVRVVVLLPRRVAAVTVSNRVAQERGERIGETVGYQIKCESCVSPRTLLTFCTNGVFLRNLITSSHDKLFKSLTHIIVDEIHERDKTADFSLIFIKNALKQYPHLKLIMMSATLDITVFTNYFDSAELSYEIFEVTGRLFPIKYYHLDDILSSKGLSVRTKKLTDRMRDLGITEAEAEIDLQGQLVMDKFISKCFDEGSEDSFNQLESYLADLNYPLQYVNAQESETGRTVLMAAFLHNNYDFAYNIMKKAAWDLRDKEGLMAKDYTNDQELIELGKGIELYHSRRLAEKEKNSDGAAELVSAYEYANMYFDVDYDLIMQVLLLIHNSAGGAVLVFLPGYDNISTMKSLILNNVEEFDMYGPIEVFSLHSRIQMGDQSKVFKPLTNGARKIILSTNIAETSVTIEDVNYVIDTGKVKEMAYDSKTCVSELRIDWISQACAKQRAGRAGRVSEGVCYRLYSKEKYDNFPLYQTPEMLRESLEELCLQGKKLASNGTSIEDFLMEAVEPPKVVDIVNAVEQLQLQDALDSFENITELGDHLLRLPLEPCYGKMLLFACILKCLDPVLTIVSFLGSVDPFKLPVESDMKTQATFKKLELSHNLFSDHFVYLELFKEFIKAKEGHSTSLHRWCEKMFVNKNDMFSIERTRDQLLSNLRNWRFVNFDDANKNSHLWPVVKAAITAGLSHNIMNVSLLIGKKSEERFGSRLSISNTSVLLETLDEGRKKKVNLMEFPSDWIVFEQKQRMQQNGGIMLKTCSVVTPITIALFGSPIRNTDPDEENQVNFTQKVKVNSEIEFSTHDEETARTVKTLKVKLNNVILNKLQQRRSNNKDDLVLDTVVSALCEEELKLMPKAPVELNPVTRRPKMSRGLNNFRGSRGNTFNRAYERVNPLPENWRDSNQAQGYSNHSLNRNHQRLHPDQMPNLSGYSNQEQWRDSPNCVQGYSPNTFNRNLHRLHPEQMPNLSGYSNQELWRDSPNSAQGQYRRNQSHMNYSGPYANQHQQSYNPRSRGGFQTQNANQQLYSQRSRGRYNNRFPRQTADYRQGNQHQAFDEGESDLDPYEIQEYMEYMDRTPQYRRPPTYSHNFRGFRGRGGNRGGFRGANNSGPQFDTERLSSWLEDVNKEIFKKKDKRPTETEEELEAALEKELALAGLKKTDIQTNKKWEEQKREMKKGLKKERLKKEEESRKVFRPAFYAITDPCDQSLERVMKSRAHWRVNESTGEELNYAFSIYRSVTLVFYLEEHLQGHARMLSPAKDNKFVEIIDIKLLKKPVHVTELGPLKATVLVLEDGEKLEDSFANVLFAYLR